MGSGSGISTAFLSIGYYWVLKILIGYFLVTFLIRYFCLVQLRSQLPLDPSARLAKIYVGFNTILGCCSSRAVEILSNKIEYLKANLLTGVFNKHCIHTS